MSDWDVISSVVGGVIGTIVAGPVGGIAGAVTGAAISSHDRPELHTAPPYPGTVPGVPPYPGMPVAPVPGPPPAIPPSSSGRAADAANADASDVGAAVDELAQLDKKSADAVAAIEAAGEAGRRALSEIASAVDAKITELGPRLSTPQGQQELRDFLKDRLTAAKQILDEQNQIALDKAREIQLIADRYGQIGARSGSDRGSESSAGGDDSTAPASDSVAPASGSAGAPSGESAPTTPAAAPMAMPGMMAPMSPGATMPAMPGFGGGAPQGGLTDPLSSLGGLAHPGTDDGLKLTDSPPVGDDDPTKNTPHLHDDGSSPPADGARHAPDDDSGTTDPATHAASASDSATAPATPDTDVRLPDGTTAHAPNAQAAAAVRAALNGASVSQAYQQAGITVPPAGAPVLDPVAPGDLRAGDVGVWKDHLVMALGEGKVLISGQVQPQSSVGSGPDFLGWTRPVRDHTDGPPPAPPQTPPGPE